MMKKMAKSVRNRERDWWRKRRRRRRGREGERARGEGEKRLREEERLTFVCLIQAHDGESSDVFKDCFAVIQEP